MVQLCGYHSHASQRVVCFIVKGTFLVATWPPAMAVDMMATKAASNQNNQSAWESSRWGQVGGGRLKALRGRASSGAYASSCRRWLLKLQSLSPAIWRL